MAPSARGGKGRTKLTKTAGQDDCCWGSTLKRLWGEDLALPACEPGFVPGGGHLRSKFCATCRRGLSVPAIQVRACSQGLADMFPNGKHGGVWTTASSGHRYRLCNHGPSCRGVPLIIFNGAVPAYEWPSMPPMYVSAGENQRQSRVELVITSNDHIVPVCLIRHTAQMRVSKPPRLAALWAPPVCFSTISSAAVSSESTGYCTKALVNQHGKRPLKVSGLPPKTRMRTRGARECVARAVFPNSYKVVLHEYFPRQFAGRGRCRQ